MSANVGLSTPRGSGTSGYVQRNLSHYKPREQFSPYSRDADNLAKYRQRKPDQQILEHDQLRQIEVKIVELRDKLEDEGVDDDDIEKQTDALRKKLSKSSKSRGTEKDPELNGENVASKSQHVTRDRQFKPHQVHEQAEAKIVESEKLRRALGISKDYEEGSHWQRNEEQRNGTGKTRQ